MIGLQRCAGLVFNRLGRLCLGNGDTPLAQQRSVDVELSWWQSRNSSPQLQSLKIAVRSSPLPVELQTLLV
jgi:hypothetical protein